MQISKLKKDSKLFTKNNPHNLHYWSRTDEAWYPRLSEHIDKCVKYNNMYHPTQAIDPKSVTEYLRTTLVKDVDERRRLKTAIVKYFNDRLDFTIVKARFDRGERQIYPRFELYSGHDVPSAIKKLYGKTPVNTFLHLPYGLLGFNTDYVKINGHGMVLYDNKFILRHKDGCVKLSGQDISVAELLTSVLQLNVEACKYIPKGERL